MLKSISKSKRGLATGWIILIILGSIILVSGISAGVWYFGFGPGSIEKEEPEEPLPGWTTDIRGYIQNGYDDYAGYAGATVRVYDMAGKLLQQVTSDSTGIFETTVGTLTSYNDYIIVVGDKTNGTALPQYFVRTMPGLDVDDVPGSITLTEHLVYKPTVDEANCNIYWTSSGTTYTTASPWNHTYQSTDIFEGDLLIELTPDGYGLRNAWDYGTSWAYDELIVAILIDENNATDQSSRVDVTGTPYDDKGTGSGWMVVTMALTEFHRELDSDGKIVYSGKTTVPFSFDFSTVSWTNCGTNITNRAFTFTAYVTIGTTHAYWTDYGTYDSTSVFYDSQAVYITV